jgi:hypothetical protein
MMLSAGVVALWLVAGQVQPETYVVEPGDTCASIATKLFGDARRYDELHRFNQLGPLPHTLKPGQVLRLRAPDGAPSQPQGPDATLTFLKPAVRTRHLLEWNPASLGMGLFRLDEVNTLKGAGAELTFRDLSSLLMEENALIVVYGEAGPESRGPRGLTLVDGELRLALAALRKAPLALKTKSTELSLEQKAEGVVAVDGAQTSRLSLFEGKALVSAQGAPVKVSANHGTRVKLGEAPEAERALPGQPTFEGAPAAAIWRTGGASVTLRWAAAERAAEYRVQLSRDEKFVDRVLDLRTGERSARAPGLEVGRYLARVIAFDEAGLQSRPAQALPVEVIRVEGQVEPDGRVWLQSGHQLAVQASEQAAVLLDGEPLSAQPPGLGSHQLELRIAGAPSLSTPLEVYPLPPKVTRSASGLTFTFAEALGAALEGFEVRCGEQRLAPTWLDAHRFVLAPVPTQTQCTSSWRGRALGGFELR